jgi:hypothetical protein
MLNNLPSSILGLWYSSYSPNSNLLSCLHLLSATVVKEPIPRLAAVAPYPSLKDVRVLVQALRIRESARSLILLWNLRKSRSISFGKVIMFYSKTDGLINLKSLHLISSLVIIPRDLSASLKNILDVISPFLKVNPTRCFDVKK